MDRERIERRDFPTGRRGYDPAAVDEHLRRLADEFEARTHPPVPSMADSTSEQVRLILQAAESGAAELRAAAGSEASDHLARVQQATDGMLSKLDSLESELSRLMTALRTSGERLAAGLAELQANAAAALPPSQPGDERVVPEQPDPRSEPSSATPADAASSDASARLVALNMALGGSSRDDTRAFLAEHFSLPDLEALLDDVYARAGR